MLWSVTEEDEEELGKIAIVRQPNHRPVMGQEQTSIGTSMFCSLLIDFAQSL
jgi:hypothetical protein